MIPISDENPTRLKPLVTWGIIFACVATFLWQLSFSEGDGEALFFSFGFVPRNLFDSAVTQTVYGIPWPLLTLITSMFLHGGFLHLGGNMLYLWIFGNNVEDAMGHTRFVLFYLACGITAALAEGIADRNSALPMVGASGAANPRVPVPKLRVVSLSPTFAGRDKTLCRL